LNVLGWGGHYEIHIDFLVLVGSLNDPLYLSVPVLGILEEEIVSKQDHDVLFIVLGISCLLSEVNEIGSERRGIVSVEIWVVLDSIHLLFQVTK